MKTILIFLFSLFLIIKTGAAEITGSTEQPVSFTQTDRDRLIRIETTLEQQDKRFVELREDMNKRFEQVDKRFEQVDKRFEQTNTYIGWLMAMFAAITATTIGFAIWDRRTMIRPFETKVREMEISDELKNTRVEKILSSLRELARTDSKVADALRSSNLL